MSESNRDHVSGMPDEILHYILSLLPTPHSVRTSVLSRRWRHLWRYVPAFHFDIEDPLTRGIVHDPVAVSRETAEKIDQFIARRDAACPLLRFHLHIHTVFNRPDSVSGWVSYAGSHGVRNMSALTFFMREPPPLSTFFCLPSLEALELQHAHYRFLPTISPQLTAPRKLKVLTLHVSGLSFPNHFFVALLSAFPDLQKLILYHREFGKIVEITTPNLHRPTLDSNCCCIDPSHEAGIHCPMLDYFNLSSWSLLEQFHARMPSLRKASIGLTYTTPSISTQISQIFVSFLSVTKLTLRLKPSMGSELSFVDDLTPSPIFPNLEQLKFIADIREDYIEQVLLRFLIHSQNVSLLDIIHEEQSYLRLTEEAGEQHLIIPASLKVLDHLSSSNRAVSGPRAPSSVPSSKTADERHGSRTTKPRNRIQHQAFLHPQMNLGAPSEADMSGHRLHPRGSEMHGRKGSSASRSKLDKKQQ